MPKLVSRPPSDPSQPCRARQQQRAPRQPLTTIDVVDHSRTTDALERALDAAACCGGWRHTTQNATGDEWVQLALQQLEAHALTLTVTGYRLIGWGPHDPVPRGWGCYRVSHTRSGEWYEMVASRAVSSSTSRALAVRGNMAALLEVLLEDPLAAERDDTIPVDIDDRPTARGWPARAAAGDGDWDNNDLFDSSDDALTSTAA